MSTDGPRLDGDRVLRAVLVIAGLALLARFVALGWRVAHFDEGRVAYWVLHWLQTGEFHYRYIIHGPFVQHVDRVLFALVGPSDFVARLPVALVGGLLPLVALAFRDRLSGYETVGLTAFLAVDPILLYYGRFMRSTVLVAAFCFVAFAAFLAWYDGKGARYFHLGVVALALGFTAKENAILYVFSWLGAGVLVLDHKLFQPGTRRSGLSRVSAWGRDLRARADAGRRPAADTGLLWVGHLLLAGFVFCALILFFYAPRGGGGGAAVGFWQAVGTPALLPDLVSTTVDDIAVGYGYWFSNPTDESVQQFLETFVDRLGRFVGTAILYSGPLFVLAVGGFLYERFVADEPRLLVLFASYWGFASVVGYPLGTDIWGAWIIVNALVPLAIPAAVVVGLFVSSGWESFRTDDQVGVGIAAAVLVLLVGQVALAAGPAVYLNPTSDENELVQYAQPQQEMRGSVEDLRAVADGEGTDVLVYGDRFNDFDSSVPRKPACIEWFDTLPFAWYFNAHGASVACHDDSSMPDDYELPPMVVVDGHCALERTIDCRDRPDQIRAPASLTDRVPDRYDRRAFFLRTTGKPVVVFTDPRAR